MEPKYLAFPFGDGLHPKPSSFLAYGEVFGSLGTSKICRETYARLMDPLGPCGAVNSGMHVT